MSEDNQFVRAKICLKCGCASVGNRCNQCSQLLTKEVSKEEYDESCKKKNL